jgi:hypothetical protein
VRVNVNARGVYAKLSETSACDQADVAGADYGNMHLKSDLWKELGRNWLAERKTLRVERDKVSRDPQSTSA